MGNFNHLIAAQHLKDNQNYCSERQDKFPVNLVNTNFFVKGRTNFPHKAGYNKYPVKTGNTNFPQKPGQHKFPAKTRKSKFPAKYGWGGGGGFAYRA